MSHWREVFTSNEIKIVGCHKTLEGRRKTLSHFQGLFNSAHACKTNESLGSFEGNALSVQTIVLHLNETNLDYLFRRNEAYEIRVIVIFMLALHSTHHLRHAKAMPEVVKRNVVVVLVDLVEPFSESR